METILEYSVLTIVVIVVLRYFNLIVTPERLEKKHREILKEVEVKFVTWQTFNEFKNQFKLVQDEVHALYEHIIGGEKNDK
jgi:hypothetical protein